MDFITNLDNAIENLVNEIFAINFSIPDEIFNGLEILTHLVGYIMPLYLYQPIIVLVLGYWLLMITSYFVRWAFNTVSSVAGTLVRLFK